MGKLAVLFLVLALPAIAQAGVTITPGPSSLTVSESDGNPSSSGIQQLEFGPNQVAINGNKATITITGGSSGASALEVFTPSVASSPTASISFFGNDFKGLVVGSTFSVTLNPATTDFIENTLAPSTASQKFSVATGTFTTKAVTPNITFSATSNLLTHQDGTQLLSTPDTNSMYFGYNTNLINTGGVFNFAAGPTCMPYPGSGNFNSCVGPFGMSANVITTAENNNSMGYAACGALRAGFYNSCMGGSSGNALRDGNYNSYNGAYSGFSNVDNNGITASGFESSRYLNGGNYVTSVGYQAGNGTATVNANTTGSSDTYIGKQTGQGVRADTVVNNSFAIGIGALVNGSGEGSLGGRLGSGTETNVYMASMTVQTAYAKVNGKDICLADGTNCPASTGGGEFKVSLSTGTLGFLVSSVSNNYTIASTSTVILADASGTALTVTLPTAVGATGKLYRVKRLNSGANAVTIATTSSETIDGATTQILNLQYTSVDLISDGSNWSIL